MMIFFQRHFLSKENNVVQQSVDGLPPSGIIFDLGCGNGQHSPYIASHKPGCTVYGVDFAETMLGYAKDEQAKLNLNNVHFIYQDMIDFCRHSTSSPIAVLMIFSLTYLTSIEIKNY